MYIYIYTIMYTKVLLLHRMYHICDQPLPIDPERELDLGPKGPGPKRAQLQMGLGPNGRGPKQARAQNGSCPKQARARTGRCQRKRPTRILVAPGWG